ncbi:hypothetical protein FMEXI_7831 [Fusarium mexicanum]|uniref:Uncharacterized protein n=1 Tax=Fusarium mexicanum TaxID=751941 RepID=A0A8H5IQY9_9HYPO|nr:hypothetical protein FMEXI_7831 [Fusarium mexicanum]
MSLPLAARTLDTMAPRSFVSLPCELRHMIYKYYLTTEQGYHFNAASRKLTTAHGEPIDLALIYTCRFVAEETKDMPFLYNDISFKTFYQEDLSLWLCRFEGLVNGQFQQQMQLIIELYPFITREMHLLVEERFPWFTTHLSNVLAYRRNLSSRLSYGRNPRLRLRDGWLDIHNGRLKMDGTPPDDDIYRDICSNNRAHSAHRAAIEFTLRLLCEVSDAQFVASVDKALVDWEYSGGARLSNFLDQCYKPWRLPSSLSDLDDMGRRLGDGQGWARINSWETSIRHEKQYRLLHRFSAVSAAIGFLDALPLNKRSSLRNINIHEDRVSSGYPDGHAIGLIPICQENKRLRIRHKLSMVRNLLDRACLSQGLAFSITQGQGGGDHWSNEGSLAAAADGLYPIVANCLAEAMFLPDAGMPDGSYTLLLDAEYATDMCSAIFQQDILDKEATRLVLARALKEDPDGDWVDECRLEIKKSLKAHAGALEHIINKTSFLESNFYPGHLTNVDTLMPHYKAIGMEHCAFDLEWWNEYDYDFTLFSHVPVYGPLLSENFESRKIPGYPPEEYAMFSKQLRDFLVFG